MSIMLLCIASNHYSDSDTRGEQEGRYYKYLADLIRKAPYFGPSGNIKNT
jgi:hypothetical protein